jgi:hypothetical protein
MNRLLLAVLIGGACVGAAGPALSQKNELSMLDQLDRGSWELRRYGDGEPARSLCLDSGRKLIQLQHPGLSCSSVIVEDMPNAVTVQYTCPGRGYGRTHVRRETNSLVQIDSQGIANGRPFVFAAEGRRVGSCPG